MGFGLPAALGAQAALPDAQVVCVSGEGSFLMNVQELATAVTEELPVKVVVLDNASLGMVRQQQDLFWEGRRMAVDLGGTPDLVALARAFGVDAYETADAGRARPRRSHATARRARPGAAADRRRAGGRLPADVPAGRRRTGDDRLSG